MCAGLLLAKMPVVHTLFLSVLVQVIVYLLIYGLRQAPFFSRREQSQSTVVNKKQILLDIFMPLLTLLSASAVAIAAGASVAIGFSSIVAGGVLGLIVLCLFSALFWQTGFKKVAESFSLPSIKDEYQTLQSVEVEKGSIKIPINIDIGDSKRASKSLVGLSSDTDECGL